MQWCNSLIGFAVVAVIFNGVSARSSDFSNHRFEKPESGRTVRVMVHKEFKLQPDGTYKEVTTGFDKKVSLSPKASTMEDHHEAHFGEETAPRMSYAYAPYFSSPPVLDTHVSSSNNFMRFTNDDVLRHLTEGQYSFQDLFNNGNFNSHLGYSSSGGGYTQTQPQPVSRSVKNVTRATTTSASAPSSLRAYPKFEIKPAASHAYFIDQGNIRSLTGYSSIPSTRGATSHMSFSMGDRNPTGYSNNNNNNNNNQDVKTVSNYGPPNSIQEILKKQPEETQNTHFYSPKENSNYNYDTTGSTGGYGSTGGSGGYNSPTGGGYSSPTGPSGGSGGFGATGNGYNAPTGSYGPPSNSHNQWSNSYDGGVKNVGGHVGNVVGGLKAGVGDFKAGVGGVVNSLVGTVRGVAKTKAAQVSSVLQQKGEVGSQILHQGGQIINSAVNQKAHKAQLIAHTLGQVPAQFSQVLRTKAHFASGLIDQGQRAFGSIVQVKAAAANQASDLFAAKGKAATAVIKASGGTAADLIIAKGKGLASLIKSGGQVATSLLDTKGNTVHQVAKVIGGIGEGLHGAKGNSGGYAYQSGGGYSGTTGGGWGSTGSDGLSGGYSEIQPNTEYNYVAESPASTYRASASGYEQLQDALKTVVQSPASSYGSPPTSLQDQQNQEQNSGEGQAKITSAFRSIYDSFKAGQNQPSVFPVGAYSTNIEVTARPETSSITQTAASIGESFNKMTKVLNNVANVITWFSPNKDTKAP